MARSLVPPSSRGGEKTHSNSPAAPQPDRGARCGHRPAISQAAERHSRPGRADGGAMCARPGAPLHPPLPLPPARAALAAPHTPSLTAAALTRDAPSAAARLLPAQGRPGLARGVWRRQRGRPPQARSEAAAGPAGRGRSDYPRRDRALGPVVLRPPPPPSAVRPAPGAARAMALTRPRGRPALPGAAAGTHPLAARVAPRCSAPRCRHVGAGAARTASVADRAGAAARGRRAEGWRGSAAAAAALSRPGQGARGRDRRHSPARRRGPLVRSPSGLGEGRPPPPGSSAALRPARCPAPRRPRHHRLGRAREGAGEAGTRQVHGPFPAKRARE